MVLALVAFDAAVRDFLDADAEAGDTPRLFTDICGCAPACFVGGVCCAGAWGGGDGDPAELFVPREVLSVGVDTRDSDERREEGPGIRVGWG